MPTGKETHRFGDGRRRKPRPMTVDLTKENMEDVRALRESTGATPHRIAAAALRVGLRRARKTDQGMLALEEELGL